MRNDPSKLSQQQTEVPLPRPRPPKPQWQADPEHTFGSNAVRLHLREWFWVVGVVILFLVGAPWLWTKWEVFQPGPDYRIPYPLANDYWVFRRWCRWIARHPQGIVFFGDSVVWGHYVDQDQTLPHYLSRKFGQPFWNAGVDGTHPAALTGLIRYYAKPIRHRKVLLQWNPLWITSPQRDLTVQKEFQFNHPELVPQFFPSIPCYRASFSDRVRICIEREIPFFAWVKHLRITAWENMNLAAWTVEHPVSNPFRPLRFRLPTKAPSPETDRRPWFQRGIRKTDFSWVDLDRSLQWRCFLDCVATLRHRGNQVFVIVGPLNEHMLTARSLERYRQLQRAATRRLKALGISFCVPQPVPSDLYADASHPIAAGYARLAQQLASNPAFCKFVGVEPAGKETGIHP